MNENIEKKIHEFAEWMYMAGYADGCLHGMDISEDHEQKSGCVNCEKTNTCYRYRNGERVADGCYWFCSKQIDDEVQSNAELFKSIFGKYATEIWALSEDEFLEWLNERRS